MENIHGKIAEVVDWQMVTIEMNEKGYTLISRFLPGKSCNELISDYNNSTIS